MEPLARVIRLPATSRTVTTIWFFVRVPVLSEQITVTDPRVSTAGSFRIRALRLSMRRAPRARVMVTTAGSPSGTTATAMLTAVSSRCRHVVSTGQAESEDDCGHRQAGRSEHLAHVVEPPLKRRRPNVRVLEHGSDGPQLCPHARLHHQGSAAAEHDDGAEIGHVVPLGDRCIATGQGVGLLVHGFRFAREGRLLDAEVHGLDNAAIGGDEVPRLEHKQVARHQIPSGDFSQGSVAVDPHGRNGEPFEGAHRGLGAVFLDESEQSEQQHDRSNRDRFLRLTQDARKRRGHDEDQDQRARELAPEDAPRPPPAAVDELVRPEPLQAVFHGLAAQPAGLVGIQPPQGLRYFLAVPVRHRTTSLLHSGANDEAIRASKCGRRRAELDPQSKRSEAGADGLVGASSKR